MLKKLFGKRAAREKWEAGLTWFRLRYLDSAGPTRCINLLSRPQACGRVALYYRPGEAVSQLYLGIPESHIRLLQHMVADFGFSLKPKPLAVVIPTTGRMTAVTALPWDSAFIAHIVHEFAFVSLVGSGNKRGSYLPDAPSGELPASDKPGREPATWRLSDNPLPGLTLKPLRNDQQPPSYLVATEPDPRRWPLGRTPSGIPLHVSGRINIYGRQEAVADWLVQQITQLISLDQSNLVVIDGAGDLVPRLKRKAAVTRLLGEYLTYIDIDGASLAVGFNPLAAIQGETEPEQVQRWQRWFQGMNIHPQGFQLLAKARQDGVGDIPGLRKWLKQVERRGSVSGTSTRSVQAISSLGMALDRLTASPHLREWLDWPTNRYDVLPDGALLFACKTTGWDRQQLVRAMLLGTACVAGVRLVVHGIGPMLSRDAVTADAWLPAQAVVSNGPLLPDSQVVFTESQADLAQRLAARFCHQAAAVSENLQLLRRHEAAILHMDDILLTTW